MPVPGEHLQLSDSDKQVQESYSRVGFVLVISYVHRSAKHKSHIDIETGQYRQSQIKSKKNHSVNHSDTSVTL